MNLKQKNIERWVALRDACALKPFAGKPLRLHPQQSNRKRSVIAAQFGYAQYSIPTLERRK